MLYKAFLIKYAEIGLKGKNRWVFENALRDQVQYNLDKIGEYRVIREQGRIFVECPKNYDYDETVEVFNNQPPGAPGRRSAAGTTSAAWIPGAWWPTPPSRRPSPRP